LGSDSAARKGEVFMVDSACLDVLGIAAGTQKLTPQRGHHRLASSATTNFDRPTPERATERLAGENGAVPQRKTGNLALTLLAPLFNSRSIALLAHNCLSPKPAA
jgi:hypothetical protein